ncbi:MAG: RsmB/NOP family class I SAM-dependent RNA methyltransferase [Rickettsiales bacterium]|nr:RsmB/NOP family class I SAM-dependent RNA methyltransferase [Rickettsiales bacterium]
MRQESRISAAIEILELIHEKWAENSMAPADAILSDYFRQRRYMGSKDRAFVSEMIYFILRFGGSLEWWLEQAEARNNPRQIVIAALVLHYRYTRDLMNEMFSGNEHAPPTLNNSEFRMIDFFSEHQLMHEAMPTWAKHNIADWHAPMLKRAFGQEVAEQISALNKEATLDLRVNTIKCPERSDLIMALDKYRFYGSPTPHSPLGVRLNKREPVFTTDAFKNGWFEVQDEGSQIVAQLVDAEPSQKVIDFCAGAGGKTLAIAATMKNKGNVLAWDTDEKRLNQIQKRASRAGVENILLHVLQDEDDKVLRHHQDSADWVLTDVPCSGSGTWRRNPDLKWRFSRSDLKHVLEKQKNILNSAARLVKPQGRLVYATCSVFEEENEDQIEKFLVDHPDFRVERPAQLWNKLTTYRDGIGLYIRLTPHKDGTDGFFAVIIKRL